MDDKLKQRTIATLDWLTEDAMWRFDDTKLNPDENTGGYSDKLTEAIAVLEELKRA